MKRAALAYQIFEVENPYERLNQILIKIKEPIIVYCPSRNKTEQLCKKLNQMGHNSTFYHGGLSAEERSLHYQLWMNEEKGLWWPPMPLNGDR